MVAGGAGAYSMPEALSAALGRTINASRDNIETLCGELVAQLRETMPGASLSPRLSSPPLPSRPKAAASQGKDAVPFLYDQGELAGRCSVELTYVVKRLLKSLASTSIQMRANSSAALYVLFSEFSEALLDRVLLSWTSTCLKKSFIYGEGAMSNSEKAALFAGRLMAYGALIKANKGINIAWDIARDTLRLWLENANLAFICQSLLVLLIKTVACQEEASLAGLVVLISDFLREKAGKSTTQAKVAAIYISLRYLTGLESFPGVPEEFQGNLLSPLHLMSLLALADRENVDHPTNYALYSAILQALASFPSKAVEFELAWSEVTSVLLARPVFGGAQLIRLACGTLSMDFALDEATIYKAVFNPDFVAYVVKNNSLDAIVKTIPHIKDSPTIASHIVRSILTTEAPINSSADLVTSMGLEGIRATLAHISHLALNEGSDALYAKLASLHYAVFKASSPGTKCDDATVQVILCSLVNLLIQVPKKEAVSARVQSILARLLTGTASGRGPKKSFDEWMRICLDQVDASFTLELHGEELDEPVRDAWKAAHDLLPKIQYKLAKSKDENRATPLKALQTMVIAGRLLLVLDPLASASIFDDLKLSYKKITKGGDVNDDSTIEPRPIEVLLDILVQWQSRSSSLLRLVADNVFKLLAPKLTKENYKVIFDVLTTAPVSAEEDEMMDDEGTDDEDGHSSEEEEEDDVDGSSKESSEDESESDIESELVDEEEPAHTDRAKRARRDHTYDDEELLPTINLKDADPADLQRLDSQLSAIMKNRKDHRNEPEASRRALIHFKQRLLDWLPIIIHGLEGGAAFMAKVKMIEVLLAIFPIHYVANSKTDENRTKIDRELLDKATSLFNRLYSKPPADLSIHCKDLTQENIAECTAILEGLLADVKRASSTASGNFLSLSSLALQFLIQSKAMMSVPEASGIPSKTADLLSIWISCVKESDKKSSLSFLSFFEGIRPQASLSMIEMLTDPEARRVLMTVRPFVRTKIYKFIDGTLKKPERSGTISESSNLIYRRFFEGMVEMYVEGFEATKGAFRNVTVNQLRDELAFLNVLICKSRPRLPQEEMHALWPQALEAVSSRLDAMVSSGQMQSNQVSSVKNRITSMRALISSKK